MIYPHPRGLRRLGNYSQAQINKSFLVLFFKKEPLSYSCIDHTGSVLDIAQNEQTATRHPSAPAI
jgi:hypothetical protein